MSRTTRLAFNHRMRSPRPRSAAAPCDGDHDNVFLTPRATPKPLKRRARPKRAATKVKHEPPEVDVSRVRPPSPSDDPLLLSGSRRVRSPPLRARFTPAFSSSPSDAVCAEPASFAARLSRAASDADVHALPTFSLLREGSSSAWSDSDDDAFNLTSEYTGRYKILKVPTKADPETGGRVAWGRPVSPFPYSELLERSLPLPEQDAGRDDLTDADMWEVATEPPVSDVEEGSPPPAVSEDEFADLDADLPWFDVDAESTQVRPLCEQVSDSDQTTEEEEEAQVDRELSVAVDDGCNVPALSLPDTSVDDGSSDEEEDVEEDIIKITSGDPKAAARAAAILRMHDYDCILAAERKRRSRQLAKSTRKRRKTIENAGISKSYMELKSQQWQTVQGIMASPGSRSLPLLELWRDAEDSVFLEHHSTSICNASFTLSPLKPLPTRPDALLPPLTGEWTRDCWKCLDKCLTAERLAVAAARSLDTDVFAHLGDISKDAVLARFMSQLGGESVLVGLGPEWSRDNLIMRLDVLIKKQSRSAPRSPPVGSFGTTEPCYSGLLREAMALSAPLERCKTTLSDTTVVPDACEADLSWQMSCSRAVRTPSRSPDPRPAHPKEQVYLRHASPQKSMIPVPIKPKRLVDLRHLSPTKADARLWRPAARRSSGVRVRDLVQQYESLDQ